MSELAIFRRFRVSTPQLVVVTGILFVIGWFIPMMGCHASGENWPQVWAIWLFPRVVEGPVRPTHMVVRRKAWTAQVEAVAISYQGEDVLVPCTATQCQSLRNAKAMRVRWLRTSELPLTYEVP